MSTRNQQNYRQTMLCLLKSRKDVNVSHAELGIPNIKKAWNSITALQLSIDKDVFFPPVI